MLGTIVNTAAIVLGCLIGLILKKGIPQRATDAVMKGIALCVIYIGISGMLKGSKTLEAIIAMAAGGAMGTLIDLNGKFEKLGQIAEKTLVKGSSGIADGFVTASLGIGVGLSAVSVFVYQGVLTLLAGLLAPMLTESVIAEMTCVGSLLIFALGLNMIGITKLKIMDYVPAIFLVIPLCYIM